MSDQRVYNFSAGPVYASTVRTGARRVRNHQLPGSPVCL